MENGGIGEAFRRASDSRARFQAGTHEIVLHRKGNEFFSSAIHDVIDAYVEDGLFDVECVCTGCIPGDIAYFDDWQVLVWD